MNKRELKQIQKEALDHYDRLLKELSIYSILKDEEYIYSEVSKIRDILHFINRDNYENIIKGLGLMLVHCPKECINIVNALIKEINDRHKIIIEK